MKLLISCSDWHKNMAVKHGDNGIVTPVWDRNKNVREYINLQMRTHDNMKKWEHI